MKVKGKAKTANPNPENQKFSLYMGAAVSSWTLTAMIITAEFSPLFKGLLKSIFTHHWIGKIVITTAVFVLAGFLLKNKTDVGKYTDENVAYCSVIASLAIIFLFFIIHYLA